MQRDSAQGGNRIDPACRQENQPAAVTPGVIEAVDRANQICVEQITHAAVVAGMHRWLSRAFDNQIGGRKAVEILGIADVAVNKIDTAGAQPRERQFATAAMKIVESDHRITALSRQH